MIDGEMQADTAVVPQIIDETYPFSTLKGGANVLVFPNLESGNIAYKLLQRIGGAELIGPLLTGLSKPVHVLQRGAEVNDIVHVAAVAVVDAQEVGKPYRTLEYGCDKARRRMHRRTYFFRQSHFCRPAASAAGAPAFDLAAMKRPRVLRAANRYLSEEPVTVTAASSPRSAGGKHDFFSEGDYWWPDPKNPDGPYIQRDGMTNPDNFVEHRKRMIRLSLIVPALAAAYKLTRDRKYSAHAAQHLRAWFIDDATRMNPNLQYAQAIKGRFTGRGTGIIDTLHLVEVARATWQLDLAPADLDGVKKWFAAYTEWMTTHPYGIAERDAKNNHGTCW